MYVDEKGAVFKRGLAGFLWERRRFEEGFFLGGEAAIFRGRSVHVSEAFLGLQFEGDQSMFQRHFGGCYLQRSVCVLKGF